MNQKTDLGTFSCILKRMWFSVNYKAIVSYVCYLLGMPSFISKMKMIICLGAGGL